MRRRVLVALALAAGLATWRRPLAGIRLIRWLDQRSGIDGPSGARVYDRWLAPMAGWLYQRVAADVAKTLGDKFEPVIVDVGTGPGLLLIAVAARCPTATIIGIDPAEPMRVAAGRRLARANLDHRIVVMAGAAERLPLPDTSVDLIVSSLASHHWSEPATAIRELLRVLRPGAKALIYDLRFAGLADRELDALAMQTGVQRTALTRHTLRGGLLRLFAQVTLTAPSAPVAPSTERLG
jgi:ubiquinone/menaquinone biosynthesis C-methylase UbiE